MSRHAKKSRHAAGHNSRTKTVRDEEPKRKRRKHEHQKQRRGRLTPAGPAQRKPLGKNPKKEFKVRKLQKEKGKRKEIFKCCVPKSATERTPIPSFTENIFSKGGGGW